MSQSSSPKIQDTDYISRRELAVIFKMLADYYGKIADQAALDGVISPVTQTYQINREIFRVIEKGLKGKI